MSAVAESELVLVLLLAVVVLELAARLLRLPPAAALIFGGGALTFVPGMPDVEMDPDLVLLVFLPPLLIASAYFAVWRDLRSHLLGILNLAVGAVLFTTLLVGVAAHWAAPGLPWAACFALGAVVSPPDAVAAKAVLEHVRLPRRTLALLEGESLFNDAAGIVLFRLAVAAAMTGTFSAFQAATSFAFVAAVGVAVGAAVGFAFTAMLWVLSRRREFNIGLAVTLLMPWAAYIGAEHLHGSGVIATVAAGLILGWYQHKVFRAKARQAGTAVWLALVYLLETFVFVLIGLSLHQVLRRLGSADDMVRSFGIPVLAVVGTVVLSRFAWVVGTEGVARLHDRLRGRTGRPGSLALSVVVAWAGMRGVVTLAIALSLPTGMPGRDLVLVSGFVVILVTVLLQGSTLGLLVRWLGAKSADAGGGALLTAAEARVHLAAAQLAAVEGHARDGEGRMRHPRLLEQYTFRAEAAARASRGGAAQLTDRAAHFGVVLAAVAAGRAEALRLHRTGQIHDEHLRLFEQELDLEELAAERSRPAGEATAKP